MAQVTLQPKAFRKSPKTGSDTKNIADLIIAKGTNEAGKVTNPEVYNAAIEFLKGGRETEELDIDIQKKIAGYENDLKSLNNKKQNQKRSLNDFKKIQDSVSFNDLDVEFRDPWRLLESTILEKDRMLLDVLDAIESKSANDEDVDNLEVFADELAGEIDELDDLRSQLGNADTYTPGKKTFDTFTYVVNSDPDGQGIKGATIVPTRLLPKNYQRTNESVEINGAYVPVAIPTTVDKRGKIYGSMGGQIYTAPNSTTPLRYRSEKPGTFSLRDETIYSKKKSGIANGAYVQGTIDYDDEGNPIIGILKKGDDGKLYNIDNETFQQLKSSPTESQKLGGYIETLNAREFSDLYSKSEPFKFEPLKSSAPSKSFYPSGAELQAAGGADLQETGGAGLQGAANPASYFGSRINTPTPPREPSVGKSTPDIIEQGKSIFRKAAGFFSGRT